MNLVYPTEASMMYLLSFKVSAKLYILKTRGHVFWPFCWTKCKIIQLRGSCCRTLHSNIYYFCIYLTCILYCFSKLHLTIFLNSLLLEKWGAQLIRWHRVFEKIQYCTMALYSCIIWGMSNRPTGGHSSETLSHPINMNMSNNIMGRKCGVAQCIVPCLDIITTRKTIKKENNVCDIRLKFQFCVWTPPH
jgi:hypothetical protein